MTEHRLKITGVHYAANPEQVAGQPDTEEMHVRTLEMLRWVRDEAPFVVLAATSKLQQEIESIKEYKQRLISDVVTGQIKVC